MKKNITIIFFFVVSSFFVSAPVRCFAVDAPNIVINEIAWMGTAISANDEWIELYNNSDNPINLDGWMLIAEDGAPDIKLSGSILAKDFYLLERTDDNTVPNITADLIYTGAIGNNGENLGLYDKFGNLIDEVNCSSGWPAGDNKTKQTMERIDHGWPASNASRSDAGWQTSTEPGGTPKQENSEGKLTETESLSASPVPQTPTAQLTTTISPAPLASIIYPDGIIFNEVLPSPEGADAENEWIEIFNQNNFEVDLSGWKIKDIEGAVVIYSFSEGTKIPGLGYLIISRKESKITMNNDKDSLTLLQPDGKIADTVSYEKAPLSQSYNKTENDWQWNSSLTPGAKNSITNLPPESGTQTLTAIKSEQKETTAALVENLPATKTSQNENSQTENNLKNYIPATLISLFIAIFSAIAILFLRKKTAPTE